MARLTDEVMGELTDRYHVSNVITDSCDRYNIADIPSRASRRVLAYRAAQCHAETNATYASRQAFLDRITAEVSR